MEEVLFVNAIVCQSSFIRISRRRAIRRHLRCRPYDVTKDAVWMDIHRNDKEIAYTTAWHVYNVDDNYEYDMNPRLAKGDAILAMKISEHNLLKYERLTDSAVVMNLRMVLHFAGDIHCPTHSYVPGPRCFWPCTLNGKKFKFFHSLYDYIPTMLHPNKSCVDVAAEIGPPLTSEGVPVICVCSGGTTVSMGL